jgi:hypothetical protein
MATDWREVLAGTGNDRLPPASPAFLPLDRVFWIDSSFMVLSWPSSGPLPDFLTV